MPHSVLIVMTAIWIFLGLALIGFAIARRRQIPVWMFAALVVFGALVICSSTLIIVGLYSM